MKKMLHGKKKYSDEEFDDDRFDKEDEIDDPEDENDSEDNDDPEEDDSEDNDDPEEDDSEDNDDSEEDDSEDNDDPEEDDPEDDDEDEEDEEDDEEEDTEEDRRAYRRRRRIRNQIICYAVVAVLLGGLIAGGVYLGKNIAVSIQEKKQAQAELERQIQEEQEAEADRELVIDTPETLPEEPETAEEPEEDYLGELVDSYLSEMPLGDKVAGLFIVTPEAITGVSTAIQAGEGTQTALNEYAVGGLIYFEKNIIDEAQLKEMLANTDSMSKYPIFLAVDEEGGSVSRVAQSSIEVAQVGDMAAIGESQDAAQALEAGTTIGAYLKDLGFNLDFAPVADVAGAEGSELGNRVFGSDAQAVGEMVSNAVKGIESSGVSSCLKHFPGIGYVEGDTHDGRVETTKTLDEMRNNDFIPFKAGIEAGADMVMVSHVAVADGSEEAVPSTLSKTIMTDVLRNELGFEGVIITDALNMSAVTEYYTSAEAAVGAIEAGADMLLMPEDFYEAYEAVLAAVQDGTIPEERIDESLNRIYRIKCADKLQ